MASLIYLYLYILILTVAIAYLTLSILTAGVVLELNSMNIPLPCRYLFTLFTIPSKMNLRYNFNKADCNRLYDDLIFAVWLFLPNFSNDSIAL